MTREAFLARVRAALHHSQGTPAEAPPSALPLLLDWNSAELIEPFKRELGAVGGHVHLVGSLDEARERLKTLLTELGATSFIHSSDEIVDEVLSAVTIPPAQHPADADVGLVGVRAAIAATGSLIVTSHSGRTASLLPMTVIALVRAAQLVPTLSEALEAHAEPLPSALVQITGPSRTADIELTLTTGVHGPGVVHVILIQEAYRGFQRY